MSSWNDLYDEINAAGSVHDLLRRKYLSALADYTGRNVITYYSGWLNKPEFAQQTIINDEDKNGFMATIKDLDREKGLDLILHTQGGETAATESLVDYLKTCFTDIRAIIPQIAMSGGTMIACACKSIVMGKQSSLGPIDPQIQGVAAHGILEEYKQAVAEIASDPSRIPIWQVIFSKYYPALIGDCKKAIDWSEEMVKKWLSEGMLQGEEEAKINEVIKELSDQAITKSHGRHLSAQKCKDIGLKIEMMEDNQDFQNAILAIHHSAMLTFSQTPSIKIIENQNGKAYIKTSNLR
jgi:membrane-bound ClpP family serine protease